MTHSTSSTWIKGLAIAGLLALSASASVAVSAGDSTYAASNTTRSALHTWTSGANHAVDEVMYYPSGRLSGSGIGKAQFRVTVDREGNVIASKQTRRIHTSQVNRAAKNVLKRADFPALPSDYDGQKLTFLLELSYGVDAGFIAPKRKLREGTVSSRQIADNNIGITILDTNAE